MVKPLTDVLTGLTIEVKAERNIDNENKSR